MRKTPARALPPNLRALEQNDAAPDRLRLLPFRIGKKREQTKQRRQAAQLRRRVQHAANIDRLPPALLEKVRTLGRTELQRRARLLEARADLLLQHLQQRGIRQVSRPSMKGAVSGEIG